MSFQPCENLPQLEHEPNFDWSLFDLSDPRLQSHQSLLLSYACQRDYLSTPKTFMLLQFDGTQTEPLSYQSLSREDFLAGLDCGAQLNDGLYYSNAADENRLLLITPSRAVEILFETMKVLPTVYHLANSTKAITEYLSRQ